MANQLLCIQYAPEFMAISLFAFALTTILVNCYRKYVKGLISLPHDRIIYYSDL